MYIDQKIQIDLIDIFSSVEGSKFSDSCLKVIQKNKNRIFSEEIIKVYKQKIDSIN